MNKLIAGILFPLLFTGTANAQVEMADTMRSEGKIYVVVGILLIIFAGLITYLILLDRKVSRLEKKLPEKKD